MIAAAANPPPLPEHLVVRGNPWDDQVLQEAGIDRATLVIVAPDAVKSGRLGAGGLGGGHCRGQQEGGQGLFHLLQVHLGVVAGAVGPQLLR
jgi:hypothetical protein